MSRAAGRYVAGLFTCVQFGDLMPDSAPSAPASDAFARDPGVAVLAVYVTVLAVPASAGSASAAAAVLAIAQVEVD